MALQFQKQEIDCLQNVLTQVQNLEQTQELRLTEGMPGVDQIPGCWGQVLIRSKEWNGDALRLTGGVRVWLLYVPEEGKDPETVESWIPFQTDFELPQDCREGRARIKALLRFIDARPVSAGKVLIRAGIGLQAECWSPDRLEIFRPQGSDDALDVLTEHWPVELVREAGEKHFELEEALTLPDSLPRPEKLLYYRLTAEAAEKKVLGNKLVFRGSARLHLLYLDQEGQLRGWDVDLPVSQYAQLEGSFEPEARADVVLEVTALELTRDGDGTLQLRVGLTGQYLITERQLLETAADVYSPTRDLKLQHTSLAVPALLEQRQEILRGEKRIPVRRDTVVDAVFLPDFPRQHREGEDLTLELPGVIQLLCLGPERQLRGSSQRWEGRLSIKADRMSGLSVRPLEGQLQLQAAGEEMTARAEVPLRMQFSSGTGITMVTNAAPGEDRAMPEDRPSVILCRAGGSSLWELARQNGSRVSLIRDANGLTGEPEAGKLLLIPVV